MKKIKIIKRKSIAQIVEVKREQSLKELIEENDRLLREIDSQFNGIIAEMRIINRILMDKAKDE